jgi:hypothetical protein
MPMNGGCQYEDVNVYEARDLKARAGKFSFVPNCPYVLPYRPNFLGLVAGGLKPQAIRPWIMRGTYN